VFYAASILISIASGATSLTSNWMYDRLEDVSLIGFIISLIISCFCIPVLSLVNYLVFSPIITAMKSIFPNFADFSNRYRHSTVVFSASIFMSTIEFFLDFNPESASFINSRKYYKFTLLSIAFASMFQIVYVAHKRKKIEIFSQHQNATICFAKCVSLMLLQFIFAIVCTFLGLNKTPLTLFWDKYDFDSLNYYIFLLFPDLAFQLVNSIGERSWRRLIKNFQGLVSFKFIRGTN
jgi:hypothetical protein